MRNLLQKSLPDFGKAGNNSANCAILFEKYSNIYGSNEEFYNLTKNISAESNAFYTTLTNSSKRENFLYYGEGEEELITCLHILVKFSDEQTNQILG